MARSTFLLLILLISGFMGNRKAYAQKEANIWYFGTKAGINFNTNPPQALYGGATNSYLGHSSMADSAGNLLFYVNGGVSYPGSKVFDNRHFLMPNNGFGCSSGNVPENTLIIPWPTQNGKYYLFCDNPNNEVYSIIDMSLNNGYGSVEYRNLILQNNVNTDIVGLQHKNNRDFWVIFQENQLNAFKSYLVSPTGLNLIPVVSNVGFPATSSNHFPFSTIKGSPDGTTLAYTDNSSSPTGLNKITLLNFDNATGQISLKGVFPIDSTTNAMEFSPDGKKLYCLRSTYISPGTGKHTLVQYDLTANTTAGIFASAVTISRWLGSSGSGQHMQVAPDGRIYITDFKYDKNLHVINRPNLTGLACHFSLKGFYLDPQNTGQIFNWGMLPSFIQSYFYRPSPTINQTCAGNTISFNLTQKPYIDSIRWNFGDPVSGNLNTSTNFNPAHVYTTSGNYSVRALVHYNNYSDTITKTIIIPPAITKPNLGPDRELCPGDTIILNAFQPGVTYQWQDSLTTGSVFKVTNSGTYWVQVSNACNVYSDSIRITVKQPVSHFQDTTICSGDNFILKAPTGLSYRWNTSDTTRQITINKSGTYKVEIETIPGCFFQDSVTVKEERCFKTAFIANIITPNHDNRNEYFEPKGLEPGTWDLNIYNRWGKLIYKKEDYINQWPETEVNSGTYYYLLRNKTSGKTYKGWVEVAK